MTPGYTQVSVMTEGRDALRRFQAVAGGQLALKVSMTDALRLACLLATNHLSEVTQAAEDLGLLESEGSEE